MSESFSEGNQPEFSSISREELQPLGLVEKVAEAWWRLGKEVQLSDIFQFETQSSKQWEELYADLPLSERRSINGVIRQLWRWLPDETSLFKVLCGKEKIVERRGMDWYGDDPPVFIFPRGGRRWEVYRKLCQKYQALQKEEDNQPDYEI